MKLRNKKTGDVVEPVGITCINGRTFVRFDDGNGIFKFEAHSLAELNEEWEDAPAEPLIKDEKVRKAVRAWAEACNLKYAVYKQSANEFYDPDTRGRFAIKFLLKPIEVYLNDGECYTIAELCGEEEE